MSNSENVLVEQFKEHPDVYPYIVTRMAPSLYHIMILPKLGEQKLFFLANAQHILNDLDLCLVLDKNDSIYFEKNNNTRTKERPSGGIIFTGRLLPYLNDEQSKEFDSTFEERRNELKKYCESQPKMEHILGDLTKGGRDATKEELEKLGKPNVEYKKVPNGLIECNKCFRFKGICLDPSKEFKGKVMTVNCKCDNQNRCASCSNLLYNNKLSANYYSENKNEIWHVPGFCAFYHECS